MRKLLISFVILIATATSAGAGWLRGALYGADVRSMVIDPKKPDTVFLGTSQGEIYVSNDGAVNWEPTRLSIPFPGYVVDNLLIDSRGHLWAAGWGLWGGGVIAESPDGGRNWIRRDSGLEEFSVRALAVDEGNPKLLVAGGLTGVFRSNDGGKAWTQISDQVNVESLAIDPRKSDRIWVGTWRQAWRTDDGGKKWSLINNGMVLDTDVFSITLDKVNPDNMWVSTCGWVYNSTDGGDSWTRFRDGFNNRRIHDIEIDPTNGKALFAGSVAGLYRSEDEGHNWKLVSDEGLVIRRIGLHADRPERVILGIEGDGVYVSQDAGKTFTRSSNGLRNLRVATVIPDPVNRDHIYAAVVFGGAASGIYESPDAGITWARVSKTHLPEVLSLAVGSDSDVRFVAGTEKGFFWSKDGVDWEQSDPAAAPIRVDNIVRLNHTRLFGATSDGVFTSRDGGRKWYRLGTTTRAIDMAVGTLAGNPALYALTSSGVVVFDGAQWITVDGAPTKGRTIAVRGEGASQAVFVAGSQGVKAGHVEADGKWSDRDAPDAAYAAVFGAQRADGRVLFLSSRQQHEILLADPRGAEWHTLPLPTNNTEVAAICADPFDAERYYVGTVGEGVFVYNGKAEKFIPRVVSTADTYSAAGGAK